ncbi:MAG TPA: chitobiase/beta-hexosaminidase C-terminal domain-containing protein, partial [Steroidobacteraceae bacterium]|nr:chitobiase/beta-hexosaminidase C-terminal domain-containing protein [Steroidobacteraceae bacterium]
RAPYAGAAAARPYGITAWTPPPAFLGMPASAAGRIPPLLSQTGVFRDVRTMRPVAGLIPYDLIIPFWSDGAVKIRYMAIPGGTRIGFSPTGEWTFPVGAVFVKTFELPTDAAHPQVKRRLETRLIVRTADGVYGVTYKWRPDGSDADLLTGSLTERIPVRDAQGAVHVRTWYYPSRKDCLACHNVHTPGVLGPKTRQMDRELTYPGGVTDNELRTLNHLGLFSPAISDAQLAGFPRLAAPTDASRSLEDRARSWLDANCGHCHRPGGTIANFDARYDTPLARQQLIDGPVLIDQGVDHPRVISPHDVWRSIAYMRTDTNSDIRMPPLARTTIDQQGVALLKAWILSMPGRDVLAPPSISPDGGNFGRPVTVTLSTADPGTAIHYTLDGSAPTAHDPLYTGPLHITGATIVRARAYRDGATRSITSQAVFVVGGQ